jgi:hypothetical protein
VGVFRRRIDEVTRILSHAVIRGEQIYSLLGYVELIVLLGIRVLPDIIISLGLGFERASTHDLVIGDIQDARHCLAPG